FRRLRGDTRAVVFNGLPDYHARHRWNSFDHAVRFRRPLAAMVLLRPSYMGVSGRRRGLGAHSGIPAIRHDACGDPRATDLPIRGVRMDFELLESRRTFCFRFHRLVRLGRPDRRIMERGQYATPPDHDADTVSPARAVRPASAPRSTNPCRPRRRTDR